MIGELTCWHFNVQLFTAHILLYINLPLSCFSHCISSALMGCAEKRFCDRKALFSCCWLALFKSILLIKDWSFILSVGSKQYNAGIIFIPDTILINTSSTFGNYNWKQAQDACRAENASLITTDRYYNHLKIVDSQSDITNLSDYRKCIVEFVLQKEWELGIQLYIWTSSCASPSSSDRGMCTIFGTSSGSVVLSSLGTLMNSHSYFPLCMRGERSPILGSHTKAWIDLVWM